MEKVQLILQLLHPYMFIPNSTVIREMRVALNNIGHPKYILSLEISIQLLQYDLLVVDSFLLSLAIVCVPKESSPSEAFFSRIWAHCTSFLYYVKVVFSYYNNSKPYDPFYLTLHQIEFF